MPKPKTEFAELLKIANDQLAEYIRSHTLAARNEVSRRFEGLNGRLDRLEECLKRIEAALDQVGRTAQAEPFSLPFGRRQSR